jgi:Na+-driven multidrug efflux pump
MRSILSIGLPVGIQQSLVYLGTGVTFAIIGLLGTREVAAMNVMLAMMLLSILLAVGMGVAAATLVGQALGRDQASDAKRWGWEVACLGAFGIFAFNMVVVVAPRETLGLFITDNATIALAAMPLRILALGTSVDAFGRILGFALRGAGATKLVTAVAFALQWGLQLPLVWYFAVSLGYGLIGLAACRFVLFTLESAIVAFIWRSGFWSQVHRSEQA